MSQEPRIDSEWVALNAFRELLKIASKGQLAKATYDQALEFGGELYPELLGAETSLLRRVRETDTTKEYRQRARLVSVKNGSKVEPIDLLSRDLNEIEDLLKIASQTTTDRGRVDQLMRKRTLLRTSQEELSPEPHTENQLIFRDASAIQRHLPEIASGKAYRDFELPDSHVLRVRVLHPDRPEHVTGADILYERHNPYESEASIVAVQYKIWENKRLLLTDPRMQAQLSRLRAFTCENGICAPDHSAPGYRFPCCSAFIRPTNKLQRADQKLVSTGEHLPVCQIDNCKTTSKQGVESLEYNQIKGTSLSSEVFEYLFNAGKIGSRMLAYPELTELYKKYEVAASENHVIIHAQEFSDAWQ